MLGYHQALQQENGLFWHTRESHTHWGRGNGWCAVGMAELLTELPASEKRQRILSGYRKMMAALRANQVPQGEKGAGLWRQVIDYPESWTENSATAMFTTAIAIGVANGWLDATEYAPVARNGWLALTGELDENGDLPDVCVGTGAAPVGSAASQRDFYLRCVKQTGDLHGQAPVLWAATALIRARHPL
jgi:rhamnogalacturonyl hydrolase YesR